MTKLNLIVYMYNRDISIYSVPMNGYVFDTCISNIKDCQTRVYFYNVFTLSSQCVGSCDFEIVVNAMFTGHVANRIQRLTIGCLTYISCNQ